MRLSITIALAIVIASAGIARADESSAVPLPVPLTRPEMKQYLEDLKHRRPRIPLPELTAEEKVEPGEREHGYEGRLRALYLPAGEGLGGFGFSREPDPNMPLAYAFKTQLFWIVSRANNCHY
jgi:hypothetical protein